MQLLVSGFRTVYAELFVVKLVATKLIFLLVFLNCRMTMLREGNVVLVAVHCGVEEVFGVNNWEEFRNDSNFAAKYGILP